MGTPSLLRKLSGLGMIVVVAGLIALTIAIYNKSFTTTVNVTLQAQRIGHQLIVPADVKLRGIIVGSVRGVRVDGEHADLSLAIDPADAKLIPVNVSAMILPKTLFGEKFVDLVLPANPSSQTLRSGDVIPEDRTQNAVELETVFNDLLPLLRTLNPVQLNLALTNFADALQGNGAALGENLVRADAYFRAFNPHLKTFEADISGLADLATSYGNAAPNLLATLRNFSFNAQTVVAKQDTLAAFLQGTAGFADTATAVFTQNANNLIALADTSEPTLTVLARYSPEFTCLLVGMDKIKPLLDATFNPPPGSRPELHIHLQVVQQPNGYTYPTDKPAYNLDAGPNCHGLPGAAQSTPYDVGGGHLGIAPGIAFEMGPDGSAADKAVVNAFAAPLFGEPSSQVSDLADLILGPMMRGMAVRDS